MRLNRLLVFVLSFSILGLRTASAQCPVCVVTVGGGLFLARQFGLDDLLVSLWLSGLNTVIAFWLGLRMGHNFFSRGDVWRFMIFFIVVGYFWLGWLNDVGGNLFIWENVIIFMIATLAIWISNQVRLIDFSVQLMWGIIFYLVTMMYLVLSQQIGVVGNTYFGFDKIFVGMLAGLFAVIIGAVFDKIARYRNHGMVLFPYQKVAFPLINLVVLQVIFTLTL